MKASPKATFKVSGKKVALSSEAGWKFERRPGGWIIAISPEGLRHRMMAHELKGKLSVSLHGRLWHGEVSEVSRQSGGGGSSDSDLVAQFPGKVRKILVAEGVQVKEGESLLLVEAMKMEFAVKAPYSGRVTKIRVKEGQQLSPGDRFVDFKQDGKNGS